MDTSTMQRYTYTINTKPKDQAPGPGRTRTYGGILAPLNQQNAKMLTTWQEMARQVPTRTDPLGKPNKDAYPVNVGGHPEGSITQRPFFGEGGTAYSQSARGIQKRGIKNYGTTKPTETAVGMFPQPGMEVIKPTPKATHVENHGTTIAGHMSDIHDDMGQLLFVNKYWQQQVFTADDRSLMLGQKEDRGAGTIHSKY